MKQYPNLYIDGRWTAPIEPRDVELVDPTREEVLARVALGSAADADLAVAAAQRAFQTFSVTPVEERIALIDRVIDVYESHIDEFSDLIAREVGIPVSNRARSPGRLSTCGSRGTSCATTRSSRGSVVRSSAESRSASAR
jgi:aldehyde dehydrogenase (NAD+)